MNTLRKPKRRPEHIPEPRDLTMPPEGYQPRKGELEEEIDMPGMSEKRVRDTFFRPFRFVKESK